MIGLPVRGWRLWYGDGAIFTSEDGPWSDAPAENVQVLEVIHEPAPYRTLTYGLDEYLLEGESVVKHGRYMTEDGFAALVARVIEDGDS